jgi:hypothetical protein
MKLRTWLSVVAVCVLALGLVAAPGDEPDNDVGKAQVRTLAAARYAYRAEQVTFATMGPAIMKVMQPLTAAIGEGKIKVAGPTMFVFEGAGVQEVFTLKIGTIIAPGSTVPEGWQVTDYPPYHCISLLYTGKPEGTGAAWGQLNEAAAATMLDRVGVGREYYLHWEGPQSPNNVVMLAMELKK